MKTARINCISKSETYKFNKLKYWKVHARQTRKSSIGSETKVITLKNLFVILYRIQQSLQAIDRKFDVPDFIEFILEPLKNASNPMLEASKLTKELKMIAPAKWQGSYIIYLRLWTSSDFLKEKVTTQKAKYRNLLTSKYPDYWKQGSEKYIEFLFAIMSSGANRAREVNEALNRNDSEIPPFWFEFLEKSNN